MSETTLIRRYEGSPLQRYHRRQREASAAREAQAVVAREEIARRLNETRSARALQEDQRQAAVIRHHAAKRRVAKIQRTPLWADREAILALYVEAVRLSRETGVLHHVDHRIPLQGRLVSGLHVHQNLQILTASANSIKSNKFEVSE